MSKQRKKKEGVKRRTGSKFWWVSYTNASGTRVQRSSGTTSKGEALALRNKWKTEVWNQQAREIEPPHTFEQLVVAYLTGTSSEKRSSSTDVKRFRYLATYFPEGMLMNDLTARDVVGCIEHRQSCGVSNKTINKELSLLSSSIKWARKRLGWNLPNPVIGHRLPEINEEARCLTVDEFVLLLKAARRARPHTRNYLPEFCILGFNTMMRPGEMLELKWDRVDFDNKVVRLEAEYTKGKARRLVPLNRDACAALRRLRRVCDDHVPNSPYVFTHTSPRYVGERVGSVATVFQSAVRRARIAHATPHTLRHTGITEGVHAPGANVVDISHIAGHKDLRTTMRYIHTSTPRLHDAVAKLPNVSNS